jgi:hypothetical protein
MVSPETAKEEQSKHTNTQSPINSTVSTGTKRDRTNPPQEAEARGRAGLAGCRGSYDSAPRFP